MAVTAISGAASADTWPSQVAVAPNPKAEAKPTPKPADDDAVKPRLLPSGAPACGNVMFKSYQPRKDEAMCAVIRSFKQQFARKWQSALKNDVPLTLEPATRPEL